MKRIIIFSIVLMLAAGSLHSRTASARERARKIAGAADGASSGMRTD